MWIDGSTTCCKNDDAPACECGFLKLSKFYAWAEQNRTSNEFTVITTLIINMPIAVYVKYPLAAAECHPETPPTTLMWIRFITEAILFQHTVGITVLKRDVVVRSILYSFKSCFELVYINASCWDKLGSACILSAAHCRSNLSWAAWDRVFFISYIFFLRISRTQVRNFSSVIYSTAFWLI